MPRTIGSTVKSAAPSRMGWLLPVVAAGLLLWPSAGVAQAQVIFQHSGSTDPTTEGWTEFLPAVPGVTAGPLSPDPGFGINAWFIDDNSTAGGSTLFYVGTPTDAQIAQASALGWKLSWRLRVVDVSDPVNGVDIEYANGTKRYTAVFGSDASGNPIIRLADGTVSGGIFSGGPSFTPAGSGYHLYELVFDPVAGSADLFVDGIEVISDYPGHTTSLANAGKRVAWAAGGSITTGQGNWSLAEFEIAPAVQVPFEHSGANNPTAEGWTASVGGGAQIPLVGPVVNDLGSGLDAWMVNDIGTGLGDTYWYGAIPTAAEIAMGATFGWRLSTFVRHAGPFPDPGIGAPPLGFDGSPFISYRNGTRAYQIHFGAQADGDPIVWLSTAFAPSPSGHQIVLDGVGAGYHLYEMVFDPTEGDVDVFVDGVERFNNFAGAPLAQTAVLWGAGSSCCLGQGNYNLVRFEVGSDTPPIAEDDSYATDEDTTLTVDAPGVLGNDSDPDGDVLTAVVVSEPSNGILVVLNPDGSFTYTPALNYNGQDSFTYKANDGSADSEVATVTITVTAINDIPTADDQAGSTDEDVPVGLTLSGSDVDGDSLTFAVALPPSHGTLSGVLPALTYTPDPNFNGSDSFTFTVDDGHGGSDSGMFTFTVFPVNDAPVAGADTYAVDEDAVLTVPATGVLGNDSDVDGDSLTAVLVSGPSSGTLALAANGSFGYTPNANFHGADAFTYRANDGTADSDIATVTVTVNAVNDQPIANDDAASAVVGTPQAIGVLANDTDIDGDALVVAVVTQGTFGSVVNNGGDVTYTADNVFASLIARIGALPLNNGQKNSLLAKLKASEQSFARGNRTAGFNQLGALINEVDALKRSGRLDPGLADSLMAQVLAIQSGSLTDTFTYTVGDGNGGTDTATVTVTVSW